MARGGEVRLEDVEGERCLFEVLKTNYDASRFLLSALLPSDHQLPLEGENSAKRLSNS